MTHLHDVQVRLGDRNLFEPPVNLRLPPTGIITVVGPSGSGKSTLLELLAGTRPPSAGTITGTPAPADIARIPQGNDLVSNLTALENVTIPLIAIGRDGQSALDTAHHVLDELGLTDVTHHLTDELSGGQQQRVAIARALAAPSQLLLADEPTTALDAGNRHRAHRLLHHHSQHHPVVITTNDPDNLPPHSRTVINLQETPVHN